MEFVCTLSEIESSKKCTYFSYENGNYAYFLGRLRRCQAIIDFSIQKIQPKNKIAIAALIVPIRYQF